MYTSSGATTAENSETSLNKLVAMATAVIFTTFSMVVRIRSD